MLTGAGRSAIAVVALWGPRAETCLAGLFRPNSERPFRSGQVRYGVWVGGQGAGSDEEGDPAEGSEVAGTVTDVPGESVVVTPIADDAEPATLRFEIHCHGGSAAVERLIQDLRDWGVSRAVAPVTWDLDSAEGTDPLVAEALSVLKDCSTARTAGIVLDQVRAGLPGWRRRALAALPDPAADAAESGGKQSPDSERSSARAAWAEDVAVQASAILKDGALGIRLQRPFDVVLAGPPNVGKSSLVNAMVGFDRSITMDLAGTTRDVLDAQTVVDGWPVRLRDTAGFRESGHEIERQGIERAADAIASADLVILVTEPGKPWELGDLHPFLGRAEAKDSIRDREGQNGAWPVLKVINKVDLASEQQLAEMSSQPDWLGTVATADEGIEDLMRAISMSLVGRVPEPGAPVPLTQLQLEWVRRLAEKPVSAPRTAEWLERGPEAESSPSGSVEGPH